MTDTGSQLTPAIGIIGSGRIGQAFARLARGAGREVVMSNSRGPESLSPVLEALGEGVSAVTVPEAAAATMVVLGVPWASVPAALAGLSFTGQIVVDATNAYLLPDMKVADLGGRTSSEVVAELVPDARVVKAGNTIGAALLGGDPNVAGGRRVLFLSGDDDAAKAQVAALFDAAGFFPLDLGDLITGGRMQQAGGGPLAGRNLVMVP
ncbi:MAG: 8-hydroxy-5-deazaflavin:NADPH oxidoreductase [Solirubrobacteraceae bacterium]|jgi:predicted dinucleotide-binding enzyme|nr:8-hydroxy-5-deazaflavin:NADPH oxidoreductase [Solirubrobacteraceae bacterium]